MKNFALFFLLLFFLIPISCGNELEDVNRPTASPKWTFSVLGNSISTYTGTIPNVYPSYYSIDRLAKEDMWWSILEISTKSKMIANSSWSGATVSFRHNIDTCSFFYSDERISSLSRNGVPDVIIVLGGTNDWSKNALIGSLNDDGNVDTFCGAYMLMVKKLRNNYPHSKIVLCSILPRKQGHDQRNNSGWTIREGNESICQIANKFDVFFLDMDDCGVASDITSYTFDGLHPNKTGMHLIAEKMNKEILNIMNQTSIEEYSLL